MIWNETKECMSRDELEFLQGKRLVKVVDRVYHNVEFYRKKMQQMGIEPGDIKGIEDLHKLPYTTKNDLRDTYPFGLFAAPQSEIVRIHASSGDIPEEIWKSGASVWPGLWHRQALPEMISFRLPMAMDYLLVDLAHMAVRKSLERWLYPCLQETPRN